MGVPHVRAGQRVGQAQYNSVFLPLKSSPKAKEQLGILENFALALLPPPIKNAHFKRPKNQSPKRSKWVRADARTHHHNEFSTLVSLMPTARSARLESAVKGFFKSISNLPFKIVRFLNDSSESIKIYYNISSIYYYALSREVLVPIGTIGEI